ncbi:hypothetical protein G7046_g3151 [Stylonectria norvegica]|nr:hypothetical protein G7046_g3151 [Stylonectria norvegica]
MAEIQPSTAEPVATPPNSEPAGPRPQQRGPPLHQIYALPAPIRTFPLPTFYPSNPLSLFHVVYAWIGQVLSPPPSEPNVIHQGVWSEATGSVHITDGKSTRALWEQGFYGKGSLSRSEPNWLKREQVRKGLEKAHVSEILTVQRREERQRVKWERARLEQEAIRQTRLDEARLAEIKAEAGLDATPVVRNPSPPLAASPPVSPAKLLALPNSVASLLELSSMTSEEKESHEQCPTTTKGSNGHLTLVLPLSPPVSPARLLALPNSHTDLLELSHIISEEESSNDEYAPGTKEANGHPTLPDLPTIPHFNDAASHALSNGVENNVDSAVMDEELLSTTNGTNGSVPGKIHENGNAGNGSAILPACPSTSSESSDGSRSGKRRKSVRFSPKVQSTTFKLSDPPSPNHSAAISEVDGLLDLNEGAASTRRSSILVTNENATNAAESSIVLVDKEHLQLMPEEAFFLNFGLGALSVNDPASGEALSSLELLTRFRQHSYFPPRVGPEEPELQPDDKFLVHYAVYHHFRSLGWVPRGGIKFGVDWLLYTRGPVFDHAEFGLIVIPSYSDPEWKENGKQIPQKTWQWLHGTVRVLSHVTKSLVLVYVDVPSPTKFDEALERGFTEVLKLYKVREVMVKRWSGNRNR